MRRGNIASHDPQSALHTLLTQANETDLNRTLMRAVFARWLMQDSIAGSEWLAKVGRSVSPEVKDLLTEHMVGFIARDGDHVSAMEWAKTISDEELRTKLTQKYQKSSLRLRLRIP